MMPFSEDLLPVRPEDLPPILDDDDLHRAWRGVIGVFGFGPPMLWVLMMDALGACLPVLPRIDEIPVRPAAGDVEGLIRAFSHFVEPGGSIAFLISASGHGIGRAAERQWAAGLANAASAAGLRCHRLYAVDDHELRPVDPSPGTGEPGADAAVLQ